MGPTVFYFVVQLYVRNVYTDIWYDMIYDNWQIILETEDDSLL